ncbi:TIGR03792 family protein [Myxosarcina sp. GI1]|uniref:TIGR03792 family protein n=1 Tax=Myxosarcina sp. GI1 TaxID=1541065 RepID=UPI00055FB8BD|nr:TIGR03792 family protein [Myxosarcina sp. GI1]
MVIEWLKFRVASDAREKFIQQDEAIWTAALKSRSGFIGKEVWLDPSKASEVIFVIRWQSRQQWKSIPMDFLAATEREFIQAMGKTKYKMIESKEFQIRKFSRLDIEK